MGKKRLILQLFTTFFKIGLFTFGGGYAMIPVIDSECVEKRKWLTSDDLMSITAIAESTPGPVAINCATSTGYRLAGFLGAASATFGVVLPSFIIIFPVCRVADACRGSRDKFSGCGFFLRLPRTYFGLCRLRRIPDS